MSAPNANAIGRLLRKSRGTTSLRAVATRLGVSVPYLCDVELERRTISADRLRRLATILGLDRDARRNLFRRAGYLPPRVQARLQKAPASWDHDPARLLGVLHQLKAAGLTTRQVALIDQALEPVDW